MTLIYKIVPTTLWADAEATGTFDGSAVDRADGFIHLSSAAQVVETAARHFAAQTDLLVVAIDPANLSPALRWEPSRDGALFPHLYAPLATQDVTWVRVLPLGPDGRHDFSGVLPT